MANNYENPLSSMSYTNKDYNTIWPEILDLVKKLTYRWDPSISNESDPGVILAKLDAIIADKNDYNIDKNILESVPVAVTQEPNARALFDQLGYNMHWYSAGTGEVSLKYIKSTDEEETETELPDNVTIKKYTMICNDDDSTIFTTIEDTVLPTDGTIVKAKVIQGSKVEYQINDEKLITIDYLDNENRLYFNDVNVAENGIFITNQNQENASQWTSVDNLTVEQLGQKVYKFGILATSNTPYIQFPSDASDIIGNGINIVYIKTDGLNGNVSAKTIDKFYEVYTDNDTGITLNSDNVSMANLSEITNGKNPETIDDAYRNYKKNVGVFNTLVSLRDYINKIYESEIVSNCFVVDRTNDLQSSYYIVTNQNGENTMKLEQEQLDLAFTYNSATNSWSKSVSPYDITVSDVKFVRSNNPGITDATFNVGSDKRTININNVVIDENFNEGTNLGTSVSFTLKKPLRIISYTLTYQSNTTSDLSLISISSVNNVIIQEPTAGAFYGLSGDDFKLTIRYVSPLPLSNNDVINAYIKENMNAFDLKMCILNWIDSPTTRELFDSSFNAVDNITKNENGFLENTTQQNIIDYIDDIKCIQHDFISPIANVPLYFKNRYPVECKIIPNYRLTETQQKEVQYNVVYALYNALYARKIDFGEEIDYDRIYDIIINADERINYVILDDIKYATFAVYYDDTDKEFREILISDADIILASIDTTNNKATQWNTQNPIVPDVTKLYYNNNSLKTPPYAHFYQYISGKFEKVPGNTIADDGSAFSTDTRENFRDDIFAKSVLAGKTQLLIPDNKFRRDLGQTDGAEHQVKSATTSLEVNFRNLSTTQSYTLKDNENIIFVKPNLIDKVNYSAYVKYEFKAGTYMTNPANANTSSQTFTPDTDTNYTLTLNKYIGAFNTGADSFKDKVTVRLYNASGAIVSVSFNVSFDKNSITFTNGLTKNQVYWIQYPVSLETKSTVNKDDIYVLKENDNITFYWKKSDEDSSYSYQIYGAGTIISPNFTLQTTDTQFQTQLSLGVSSGVINDTILNDNIAKQVNSTLSASKAINIKETNEVELKNTNNYCYWITNTKIQNNNKSCYELKLTRTDDESNYTRILKNNEYFMWTNNTKSQLEIVGPGTRIEFDRNIIGGTKSGDYNIMFYCPAQNYDEIVTKGVSTFTDDMWQNIYVNSPNTIAIKITEQEMVVLASGATLSVNINAQGTVNKTTWGPALMGTPGTELPTNSYYYGEGISISDIDCKLLYLDGSIVPDSVATISAIDDSEHHEIDFTITLVGYGNNNDTYKSFSYQYSTAATSLTLNSNPKYISDAYNISYYTTTETEVKKLSSVYGDIGWSAYTELAINCSPNKPQKVISGNSANVTSTQSISFYIGTGYHSVTSGQMILSSETFDYQGGENIDLSLVDVYGNISYPSIYVYTINSNISSDDYNQNTGIITLKFTSNSSKSINNVALKPGHYIISVENKNDVDVRLSNVTLSNGTVSNEAASILWIMHGCTYKFFNLEVKQPVSMTLTFSLSSAPTTPVSIQILPLYKYTEFSDGQNSAKYEYILERLQELDINKLYNYTYEVPEEELVKNPLSAKSFLDTNHIYNKFTICQMDQNEAPQILNKVR